jgi:hypothetical protein
MAVLERTRMFQPCGLSNIPIDVSLECREDERTDRKAGLNIAIFTLAPMWQALPHWLIIGGSRHR